MSKPTQTQKFYLIAAILYAASIALNCLLFPIAALLSARNSNTQIEPNVAVAYYLPLILQLVYPLLAFRLEKQREITSQSTMRTAILLPSCWAGLNLAQLVLRFAERMFLQNADLGTLSILQSTVRIPLYLTGLLGTAGFLLLCCACAEEYVLTHPTSDAPKRLSLYAVICAGSGLLLQCVGILLSEQFGSLFGSGHPVLPVKWKLVLIGLTLFHAIPFTAAAVVFWLKPDIIRPTSKLVVTPILYFVPALIVYGIGLYLPHLVSLEGMETIAAYSMANTVSAFWGVFLYAAFILTCCAGTIALFETKYAPADGGKEETHA